MCTTLLLRSHASDFRNRFYRVNGKATRATSDSFHSQIRWKLHNFLDPVLPDGVLLYSATLVNAHL